MGISYLQFRVIRKAALKALVPVLYGGLFRDKLRTAAKHKENPKRILLLNGFHVGDIVIATSVIPILRSAFPTAEIGFVTGSWSHMVVKNNPDLKYTYCIDHWKLNRGNLSLYQKVVQYRSSRRKVLREIQALQYDIAISLFTNFPDFLDFSWAAKIPVRIGFRRSVFSSLATDLVDEPDSPFVHQGARLAETLRPLKIDPIHFQLRRSTLPASNSSSIQEVCAMLKVARLEGVLYRVIHMGSGAPLREFPRSFWREVAERLALDHLLLFTGRGEREEETVLNVIHGLGNCINACNRLTWDGFVAAVRFAEVLYGVESMAGHVAGAVGTKCVVLYGGTAGVARWRPEGKDSIVLTNHVPCAPCHQPLGCAAMTCMRGIRTDDLVRFDR